MWLLATASGIALLDWILLDWRLGPMKAQERREQIVQRLFRWGASSQHRAR